MSNRWLKRASLKRKIELLIKTSEELSPLNIIYQANNIINIKTQKNESIKNLMANQNIRKGEFKMHDTFLWKNAHSIDYWIVKTGANNYQKQ